MNVGHLKKWESGCTSKKTCALDSPTLDIPEQPPRIPCHTDMSVHGMQTHMWYKCTCGLKAYTSSIAYV